MGPEQNILFAVDASSVCLRNCTKIADRSNRGVITDESCLNCLLAREANQLTAWTRMSRKAIESLTPKLPRRTARLSLMLAPDAGSKG